MSRTRNTAAPVAGTPQKRLAQRTKAARPAAPVDVPVLGNKHRAAPEADPYLKAGTASATVHRFGGAALPPVLAGTQEVAGADLATFAAWLTDQQRRALDGMTDTVHGAEGTFSEHCQQFDVMTTARAALHQFEVAQIMGGAA